MAQNGLRIPCEKPLTKPGSDRIPIHNLLPFFSEHGSYNFRQTNFKDFSRIFQGIMNRHSLTPLLRPYCLKQVMESFTICTSSAVVDHISISYYFPQRLGMTFNCIKGTEIAFEIKKQK